MKLIVVGATILLLGTYLVMDYIASRYRHTRKSKMILGAEAAICLLLGLFLTLNLVELPWYHHVVFGLTIALPAFSVISVVTVETWRLLKQGDSDSQLSQMRSRLQELQDEADQLAWQIDNLRRKKKALEREHDEDLFRQRKMKNEIEQWQSGGGMERIRSIRVEDWNSAVEELSSEQLEERIEEIEHDAQDPENEDKYEALKVQEAIAELELVKRKMQEPNEELRRLKDLLETKEGRQAEVNAEIQKLDEEIRRWVQDRGIRTKRKVELK